MKKITLIVVAFLLLFSSCDYNKGDDNLNNTGIINTPPLKTVNPENFLDLSVENKLELSVMRSGMDVVRETPFGNERMVAIREAIIDDENRLIQGAVIYYSDKGFEKSRELLDIAKPRTKNGDFIWISDDMTGETPAKIISKDGEQLWAGMLDVTPSDNKSVIPMSNIIKKEDIKPLTLRGTNWLPRNNPWGYGGLWAKYEEENVQGQLDEMKSLNINTLRTFTNIDTYEPNKDLLFGKCFPKAEFINKLNAFIEECSKREIKPMITACWDGLALDLAECLRSIRFTLEPFAYDGRILMIDMVNEPEPSFEREESKLKMNFKTLYEATVKAVPNHIVTIGLTWRFDLIHELDVRPEVEQYHNYSGAAGIPSKEGERNVRDELKDIFFSQIDERPLIIGEFGFTSQIDTKMNWLGSEEEQLRCYKGIVEGAEAAAEQGVNILGIYNWCAFHYPKLENSPGEQAFGVINPDGSLKLAGQYLKETYERWINKYGKAVWES